MTDQSRLTENELKALAYFVVGVSSEGSIAGKDVSNRLSFAGSYREGKMYPVENSGLSIGTLQKDLGQDNQATASALVASYQEWAAMVREDAVLSDAQRVSLVSDLSRNGRQIQKQKNRPIDADTKEKLDEFLRSDAGKDFVHQRDRAQVDHIYAGALKKLTRTPAYEHASIGERIKLTAVVAKAFNQNEAIAGTMLRNMAETRPISERLSSFEDVQAYTDREFARVMREGRDAALRGAGIYTHLQQADPTNPVHIAWREVLEDPLIKPSLVNQDARPDFSTQYTMVKNLFLEPVAAKRFVEALEQGDEYSRGSPQAVGSRKATSGFFVSGARFVQWNTDGTGVAYSDGSWSTLSRDDISRVRQMDGSVDLSISRNGTNEPLLHVGPTGPSVASGPVARTNSLREGARGDDVIALQAELAELGFTDARGRPLRSDGEFGAGTHSALRAFQRERHLHADGIAGPVTLDAVTEAVRAKRLSFGVPDAPYMHFQVPSETVSPYRVSAPEAVFREPLVPTIRLGSSDQQADVTRAAVIKDSSVHEARTGQAEDVTRSALQGQAFTTDRKPAEHPAFSWDNPTQEAVTPSMPYEGAFTQAHVSRSFPASEPLQPSHPFTDPRNPESPNYQLYNELQRCVPDASEPRLLQFTAACHTNMITAENLSAVYLDEERMTLDFRGSDPLSTPAQVDLSVPPPAPREAIHQIQQFDQHEMQLSQSFQMQQAQSMQHGRSM